MRRCKVDVLLPGVLNIPREIPCLEHAQDLPVLPLLALLLMKLQGWADHSDATQEHKRSKRGLDVLDLSELLVLVTAREDCNVHHRSQAWLPHDFVAAAQPRVLRFTEEYPATAESWIKVGYQVR